MSKKFFVGLSLSLLTLGACSSNTASVTPTTDEGSEYSSEAMVPTTDDQGAAMSADDTTTTGAAMSAGAAIELQGQATSEASSM
jgi:hypothetical protein